MVKTTRREFLRNLALTGAAIANIPGIARADESSGSPGERSRVIMAKNSGAISGDGVVDAKIVRDMLDRSVAKLMNATKAEDGWKDLFGPEDVVGIKVNCLFGKGVSTRPEVVQAIVEGLKVAGVSEENIIIWDRSTGDLIKCGFKPNKEGPGVLCYADDGDWGREIEHGSFKGRITKIIDEKITAIVNAPVLKTHKIAGLSCCLKNHYGSMDNPGKHHDNCRTALGDFSAIPVVKRKTRLVVVDALRPQYDGGPGLKPDAQFDFYSLITSQDPVAADYQGLQVIQRKRLQEELDRLPADKVAWLEEAQERGVGYADPSKIELINI